MPRFAVEIGIGVNQSDLAQAEKAYKRLGLSAEDALKKVEGLADKSTKGGEEIRAATVKAAASFERFAKSVETGGRGSVRELVKLNLSIEELRQKIEAAKRAGAPVSDEAVSTLRAMESQVDGYVNTLGNMRTAQEGAARSIDDATRAAGGFGKGITSVADLLGLVNPQLEQMAIRWGLAAGAMAVADGAYKKLIASIGDAAKEMGAGEEAVRRFNETVPKGIGPLSMLTYGINQLAKAYRELVTRAAGGTGAIAKGADEYAEILRKFQGIQDKREAAGRDPFAEDEKEFIQWYLEQQREMAARQKKVTEEAARTREEMERAARAAEASFRDRPELLFNKRKIEEKAREAQIAFEASANRAGLAFATELEAGITQGMDAGAAYATDQAKEWIKRGQEIAAYLREPVVSAWQSTRDAALDTLTALAMGQKIEWEQLARDWLAMWFRAMAEWLARWIEIQLAAQAVQAGTGMVTGGGGGMFGALGNLGMSAAGGGGGGGGMGSAMASGTGGMAVAGWAAVFLAVVAILKNQSKTSGRLEADTTMQFGGEGGISFAKDLSRYNSKDIKARFYAQVEAVKEMIAAISDFFDSLGGTLDKMAPKTSTLTVGREGQGKNTNWFVKYAGDLVKHFGGDSQAAFDFAMVQAIKQAPTIGLSPEVAQAIKASAAETMDALQRDMDTAAKVVRARLGDVGADFAETFRAWADEIGAAQELGLAIDDMIAARDRELQATRNQYLGINTAAADYLAGLVSLQRGIEEVAGQMTAVAQHNIAAAQQTLDALLASGPRSETFQHPVGGGSTTVTQSQADFEAEIATLRAQIARYIAELDRIPQALSDQEINMGIFNALFEYLQGSRKYEQERVKWARLKVELEFAAIRAQLIAIGKWEEFAEMFNDAFAAAMGIAEGGGRRGGGGRRRERLDNQADIRQEVEGLGLGAVASALRETGIWFAEMTERIKAAGFGAAETARLIALAAAEEQRRRAAIRDDVAKQFQEFIGTGQDPFAKLRKRHEDLSKAIVDAGFGADRTKRMLDRMNAALEKQIDILGKQEFVALGDQLFSFLTKYYGEVEGFEAVRLAMEQVRFHLELENMRARLAILAAERGMADQLVVMLGGIIDFIDANVPDWENIINPPGGVVDVAPPQQRQIEAFDDAANAVKELADRFRAAKDAIGELLNEMSGGQHGVVTARQAFEFQRARFESTLAGAKTGEIGALEDMPEISRDFLAALSKFSPALLAVEFPRIKAELERLRTSTTAREGNVFVDERFQSRHAEQLAATNNGFRAVVNAQIETHQLHSIEVAQLTSIADSQRQLSERLSLIESNALTTKRSA